MKTVCEILNVARSNVAARLTSREPKQIGRPPQPDNDLLGEVKAVIAEMPTYGYRRVWAVLKRMALAEGRKPTNHKRVYRVMKAHACCSSAMPAAQTHGATRARIAVDQSNLRWCSDGFVFDLACDNGDKVRITFALDCCDREAIGYVATTEGIKGEDERDLMTVAVEGRFGLVNCLPNTIEWLTDNDSGYIARETRSFACEIGLTPRTTPVESPQSNGMAEAFVRTMKRD